MAQGRFWDFLVHPCAGLWRLGLSFTPVGLGFALAGLVSTLAGLGSRVLGLGFEDLGSKLRSPVPLEAQIGLGFEDLGSKVRSPIPLEAKSAVKHVSALSRLRGKGFEGAQGRLRRL